MKLKNLLDKIRPADLMHNENRLAFRGRIESLLTETGLDRIQFGKQVRAELNDLRSWLSGAKELTVEALTEICAILHISIGDLVTE